MHRKKMIGWVSTLLVILLLTLTGCQAVQGFDIGQALQNSASLKSAEASGSLKLEILTGNTDGLPDDEKRMLELLKNLKVDFTHIVLQDNQHISVEGALSYAKGTIPFQVTVQGTQLIIQIEGAKKPLFFDLTAAQTKRPTAAMSPKSEQIAKSVQQSIPAILKFILNNVPNPEHFTVSSVTELIHNETLGLQKAHIEIFGNEIEGLLKKFLTSILADEKGTKELIGQLYDAFLPLIQEQMKALPDGDAETSRIFAKPIAPYLKNKTLAVEYFYTKIQEELGEALKDWDEQFLPSESDPQTKVLFSDKTALKTDLYIDSDKQIRKLNSELTIPVTDADVKSGVEGVRLTFTTELWHLNQPVTAPTIDISKGKQDLDAISFNTSSVLALFDKNSKAYALLRQDLKIAKKDIHLMFSQNPADLRPSNASRPFINDEQIGMLPVRYISERFGAEVAWDAAKKQITVVDALSEKTIVLTLGSREAHVNGAAVQLASPAILKNGSTFVPLRFIAEQLGCTVSFDGKTSSVTISRE